MAETKDRSGGGGGAFAKVLTKQISRTKAKMMQNLGKTVRTTDQTFDQYVNNFHKQQDVAHRLQKEMRHYIHCVTEMTLASKRIFETIRGVCEPEWEGYGNIEESVQVLDVLQSSYHNELTTRVNPGLSSYLSRFPETKEKISKRRRKLLDFDNARHNLDSAQNAKKKDDSKITKAQESYNLARRTFEELNTELHTELPDLYDGRVQFYSTNLQQFFKAEHTVHSETAKIHEDLCKVLSTLEECAESGDYAVERAPQVRSSILAETPSKPGKLNSTMDGYDEDARDLSTISALAHSEEKPPADDGESEGTSKRGEVPADGAESPETEHPVTNGNREPPIVPGGDNQQRETSVVSGGDNPNQSAAASKKPEKEKEEVTPDDKEEDEEGAAYENMDLNRLPVGVKYQVVATHKYGGEDDDELEFENGEIINVVEFDDPEDQDEGWEIGVKVSDGTKGLFPCNFTRRL